ncbi:MAG: ribonuclease HII [Atopobiaceae bacterium]|nr:ribonuclease HII [Atopobiaceae bacterium]
MSDAGLRRAKEIAGLIAGATAEELSELETRYADDPRRQVRHALEVARRRVQKEEAERVRVRGMYAYQQELGGDGVVIGVDEVGRGAVAGPLTVGAVVLPAEPIIWGLDDSKRLSPERREYLAKEIEQHAVAYGAAHVPPQEIDERGMAVCLRLAMTRAIEACAVEPDCVLIDGNPVHVHERERCVVKGDAKVACIAAASIVAKVTRDALMVAYESEYPQYHLSACKGYASAEHIQAIREYGLSPIHRASFCGNFLETPRLF